MVEGAVDKFLAAKSRCSAQPFVKDDGKQTVEQLLKAQGCNGQCDSSVYVVGEGIEKKKDDFAAEVAAMTKV